MTIEISGPASHPNTQNSGRSADIKPTESTPNSTRPAETGPSSTADTVSLTQSAAQLRQLESALNSLPVVDAQRVESVRQAIQTGTYEVDANRVADRVAGLESDLFQANTTGR